MRNIVRTFNWVIYQISFSNSSAMNHLLFICSITLLITIESCKKEPPPPPPYNPPLAQGQLLSYYDDQPIANAIIKLYYSNDALFSPDDIDTTDENGYFTYKNPEDTVANAIPSKDGWWCPFQYGYTLNLLGDAQENDSIIYLFKQASVKVWVHIQTPVELPYTGNFKVSDVVLLPKISASGYWIADEWFGFASDTGTYKIELDAFGNLGNTLWLSMEEYNLFTNGTHYSVIDSIPFYSDTTGIPKYDLYY